jgi:hypothetical protein
MESEPGEGVDMVGFCTGNDFSVAVKYPREPNRQPHEYAGKHSHLAVALATGLSENLPHVRVSISVATDRRHKFLGAVPWDQPGAYSPTR